MTMTPEEKVKQETLWVLEHLQEENIVTEEDTIIRFNLVNAIGANVPSHERQKQIIRMLHREKAIKISKETKRGFELRVLKHKFNEIYHFYHEQQGETTATVITQDDSRPLLKVEGTWGYLKFGKYGTKIKIGKANPRASRAFKLLQSLSEPWEVNKTIDAVFEAIRSPKDQDDSRLLDWNTAKTRKVEIIQTAIKELQRDNKLKGKIRFVFNNDKTIVKAVRLV